MNLVQKIREDRLPLLWSEYAPYLQGEGIACFGLGLKEASHPFSQEAFSCLTSSDHMV